MAAGVTFLGAPGGGPTLMAPTGAWVEHTPTGENPSVATAVMGYDDGSNWHLTPGTRYAPKSDRLNIAYATRGVNLPNNYPARLFGWIVIDGTFYCYGGFASSTDDTYAHNDPIDRIFSAPASDLTLMVESADKLPAAKSRLTAIKNDTYVYLIGPTESGRIYRALLTDPTNFTDVGAQTFGGATSTCAAYQAGSTVYVIKGSNSDSTPNIYSSAYSDLETWVDTGDTFPTYLGFGDQIRRIGNTFYAIAAGWAFQETQDIYYASVDDPTNWHTMTDALPAPELGGSQIFVADDGVYCYGGYVNGVIPQKIWSLTGGNSVVVSETTASKGYPRPME